MSSRIHFKTFFVFFTYSFFCLDYVSIYPHQDKAGAFFLFIYKFFMCIVFSHCIVYMSQN